MTGLNILKFLEFLFGCALLLHGTAARADSYADAFFDPNAGTENLSRQDQRALQYLREAGERSIAGALSLEGEIVFRYGQGYHSVICAVLKLCDIAMEPQEKIQGVQIGDSSRWSVDSAVSGSAENRTEHLVIKPLDVGLDTSLIVTTDRRVYHLNLKSTAKSYMPSVRFRYAENNFSAFNSAGAELKPGAFAAAGGNSFSVGSGLTRIAAATAEPELKKQDESYDVSGGDALKPLRVYNDGVRTYIEMPSSMQKMPALVAVTKEGGLFTDEETALVNYRVQDKAFVVDGIPEHLRLMLGDGGEELSSDIEYLG